MDLYIWLTDTFFVLKVIGSAQAQTAQLVRTLLDEPLESRPGSEQSTTEELGPIDAQTDALPVVRFAPPFSNPADATEDPTASDAHGVPVSTRWLAPSSDSQIEVLRITLPTRLQTHEFDTLSAHLYSADQLFFVTDPYTLARAGLTPDVSDPTLRLLQRFGTKPGTHCVLNYPTPVPTPELASANSPSEPVTGLRLPPIASDAAVTFPATLVSASAIRQALQSGVSGPVADKLLPAHGPNALFPVASGLAQRANEVLRHALVHTPEQGAPAWSEFASLYTKSQLAPLRAALASSIDAQAQVQQAEQSSWFVLSHAAAALGASAAKQVSDVSHVRGAAQTLEQRADTRAQVEATKVLHDCRSANYVPPQIVQQTPRWQAGDAPRPEDQPAWTLAADTQAELSQLLVGLPWHTLLYRTDLIGPTLRSPLQRSFAKLTALSLARSGGNLAAKAEAEEQHARRIAREAVPSKEAKVLDEELAGTMQALLESIVGTGQGSSDRLAYPVEQARRDISAQGGPVDQLAWQGQRAALSTGVGAVASTVAAAYIGFVAPSVRSAAVPTTQASNVAVVEPIGSHVTLISEQVSSALSETGWSTIHWLGDVLSGPAVSGPVAGGLLVLVLLLLARRLQSKWATAKKQFWSNCAAHLALFEQEIAQAGTDVAEDVYKSNKLAAQALLNRAERIEAHARPVLDQAVRWTELAQEQLDRESRSTS